ncbi:haloalkane dehalogenase [Erythrobacter sp.]|jgi:haloalkane dehalogenase|uniref:haloalkane dehalogenase n=1 Tax=Erythrobacter sp. TaxID=1042 RepID=UPI002EA63CFB|nr:haloalkane dehalogenase [Erythrobacter sp.]
MRQHYVDEGPRGGEIALLMHGEPSWSYLYRHMIPLLVAGGLRVIAPDLIGFGKSDKPARKSDYSYARNVLWMQRFLAKLDLTNITLFCQDWGGLIGLRLVAAEPERFARVMVANSGLPLGDGMSDAFMRWQRIAKWSPVMPISKVLQRASTRELSRAELAAYEAPFPSRKHKAAARVFPSLVPVERDDPGAADNRVAWERLSHFDRPFLTMFGERDAVTAGWDRKLQEHIPGARGQKHGSLSQGHHFIQEDAPEELSRALLAFVADNPVKQVAHS